MSVALPELYRHDQFLARRKVFKLFGAGFTITTLDGQPLAGSEQKAFRLKEDIRVHEGAVGGPELLRIKADRIVDFSAAYQVTDSQTGEHIGTLRRKGWSSLFRDSWEILDAIGRRPGQGDRGQRLEGGGPSVRRSGLAAPAPDVSHRGRWPDRRDDEAKFQHLRPEVPRQPDPRRRRRPAPAAGGGHGHPAPGDRGAAG